MTRLFLNWKTYLSPDEGSAILGGIRENGVAGSCVVFPSDVLLKEAVDVLGGEFVGAQHAISERRGVVSGEETLAHYHDLGVRHVLVGHSEQRAKGSESDDTVGAVMTEALSQGMVPILCIGEDQQARANGSWKELLTNQLVAGLGELDSNAALYYVAYEPVWSIGTGTPASRGAIEEALDVVKEVISGLSVSDPVLLYGGSVSSASIGDILSYRHVRGVLVGKAGTNMNEILAMAAIAK